jgi:hypothetical protein
LQAVACELIVIFGKSDSSIGVVAGCCLSKYIQELTICNVCKAYRKKDMKDRGKPSLKRTFFEVVSSGFSVLPFPRWEMHWHLG